MLIICALIFVAVFSVMFYSIWQHRKSKGAVAANFHENTTVEIVWTVIPFIIIIIMALPATRTVVAMKDTSNSDLTIKVTGYQWKWGYDYIRGEGEGISFLSQLATPRGQIEGTDAKSPTYLLDVTEPLVVPVDKKIRVITTANDVIHAWWIPAFGVKQDAIPGFARDTWFRAEKTGTYYGQCAELCGKDHAFMPIAVKVVTAQEYTAWVDGRKKQMAALADDPEQAVDGGRADRARREGLPGQLPGVPPGERPRRRRRLPGARRQQGRRASKPDQIAILLNGKNAMPSWKALSDVELAAVATYTKNCVRQQVGRGSAGRVQGGAQVKRRSEDQYSSRSTDERRHPESRCRPRRPPTTTRTTTRTGGVAGCSRPTTRTSARCTCGSA